MANDSSVAVLKRIQRILRAESLVEKKETRVELDTSLVDELHLDSLRFLQLLAAIETEFDITIDDNDIGERLFDTVQTLVDYVSSKVGAD